MDVRADPLADAAAPDVLDGEVAPSAVMVTCSLTRGRTLDPGIHPATFVWRDVVGRPPPRRKARSGAHVTYHLTEQGPDVRVSFVTHVRVDPGVDLDSPHDDVIHVEERLYVQRRALAELVEREREFSDRLALRWRSRLGHALARQRRAINRVNVAWVIASAIWFIRMEAKVGFAFIRGTRAFLRGLVDVPDALLTRSMSARRHMSSRLMRRNIFRHLRDPSSASNEEKGILFLVVSAILFTSVLVLSNVFALALPQFAPYYQTILVDAAYNIGNVFLPLPLPPEVWLIGSVLALGPVLGWTGLFIGKALGSWLLYLVGDSLHDSLEKQTRSSPRLDKAVNWIKRNANEKGFWLLFLLSVIPFFPDTLVVAFAVSGMRFRPYLGGIALGTLVKYLAIVAALLIVGPDVVNGWLDTAGYWLNPGNWFG